MGLFKVKRDLSFTCETEEGVSVKGQLKKLKDLSLLDDVLLCRVLESSEGAAEVFLKRILGFEVLDVKCLNGDRKSVVFGFDRADSKGNVAYIYLSEPGEDVSMRKVMRQYPAFMKLCNGSVEGSAYMIFVCREDLNGEGEAVFGFDNMNVVVNQGAVGNNLVKTLMVNTTYEGDDELGELMSDLKECDVKNMAIGELQAAFECYKDLNGDELYVDLDFGSLRETVSDITRLVERARIAKNLLATKRFKLGKLLKVMGINEDEREDVKKMLRYM